MNYSSKKEQVNIYLGKFFREFKNKSKITILLAAFTTPIIIRLIAGSNSFMRGQSNTAEFILACACIWLGIFNSITNICKERDIVKHEFREGLDIKSYIISHLIFQGFVVLIQSVIITILMTILFLGNFQNFFLIIPLFISIFLIIYASDALGLMISSLVNSVEEAMTVMPFVLLLQLVLAGNISLDKFFLQIISFFMISKNGFDSLLSISGIKNRIGFDISFLNVANFDAVLPFFLAWILLIASVILFSILAMKILEKNINK